MTHLRSPYDLVADVGTDLIDGHVVYVVMSLCINTVADVGTDLIDGHEGKFSKNRRCDQGC